MIARALRVVEAHPWRTVLVMVFIAAAARFAVSLESPTPWIFADELIYAEQAKGLVEAGQLRVRDGNVYYSLVTGLLGAPGYLPGDVGFAYGWIKAVNCLVMAAAALPAYGLARMALSVRWSLVFAGLVLAWPAYAYTSTVMTEPAFFSATLLLAWLLARTLQEPTLKRQILVAVTAVGCVAIRTQGVVFLVSILAAVVAAVLLAGRAERAAPLRARLGKFLPLLSFAIGLPLAVLAIQTLRGAGLQDTLGAYSALDAGDVGLSSLWTWTVRHAAVVALAVGVAPAVLALMSLPALLRRETASGGRLIAIVGGAISLPLLVQVSGFASVHSLRVQERNLFVIEPLVLLVAFVGLGALGTDWRRLRSNAAALVVAGGVLVAAIVALPVAALLNPRPISDTFGLIALANAADGLGVTARDLAVGIAIAGVAFAGLLAVLASKPRALAILAVVSLVVLGGSSHYVASDVATISRGTLAAAGAPKDWIDKAAGRDGRVAFLWQSEDPPHLVWQAEFWNRSVRSIATYPGGFPAPPTVGATIDDRTGIILVGGKPLSERLVVAAAGAPIVGRQVADTRNPLAHLVMWKTDGPPRIQSLSVGFLADGWSGSANETRVFGCRGGVFRIRMGLSAGMDTQSVRVIASGTKVRTVRVADRQGGVFAFRAQPERNGTCRLRLEFPNAETGDQIAGNGDLRLLGVRAQAPRFVPFREPT